MVIGLGALATGSGAVFSSAAFASSTASSADFRVVAEDNLVVEAGASFRGDGNEYQPNPSGDKFYGGGDDLFTDESSLADLAPEELPAAWANNENNDGLAVETAVENLAETYEFPDFLQVRNEGTEDAEVGIRFEEYGEDVNNGPVTPEDLIQAYEFLSDGGDGGKISTDGNPDASNIGNQTIDNTTTVPVGGTEQIGLVINLTNDTIRTAIAEAASPGTDDVFNGGEHDTVQLVETLRVGSDSTAEE
ncbi:hypothetical protein GCM10028858_17210 [Halorubrum pallidum]